MGNFDLTSANLARVAGQEVDLLRIANQTVWQKPAGGPESIFTTQTPASSFGDGPVTLGTVFTTSVAGTVDGIRFWAHAQSEPGRVGALYRITDDTHGIQIDENLPLVTVSDSAWNSTNFPVPVAVLANTRYVVAAYFPTLYVATGGFFATGPGSSGSGIVNGHLTSPPTGQGSPSVGNGKFSAAVGGPFYPIDTFQGGCYFVDVLFTPSA